MIGSRYIQSMPHTYIVLLSLRGCGNEAGVNWLQHLHSNVHQVTRPLYTKAYMRPATQIIKYQINGEICYEIRSTVYLTSSLFNHRGKVYCNLDKIIKINCLKYYLPSQGLSVSCRAHHIVRK